MSQDAIAERRQSRSLAKLVQGLLIVAISGGLLWLVWIYGNGLRDPHYLDGWLLAGGMAGQVAFHIAVKTNGLSPKGVRRFRAFHIFLGYLLVALFIAHSDFSLPDTGLEWALWVSFVLVTLSGIFGAYLAWSLRVRRRIDDGVTYDRIPALREKLAEQVYAAVVDTDRATARIALPGLPHDAWIMDLYEANLRDFFDGHRNFTAHLFGSESGRKRLTDDIGNLARYVDQQGQEKLAVIKDLVIEKDRLDFAHVYLGLTRNWLLVHVPVTYSLFVLTVLHVLVVYAFSSGTW